MSYIKVTGNRISVHVAFILSGTVANHEYTVAEIPEQYRPSIEIKETGYTYEMREELKTLRTNIQFCGDDKRVILLTSSVASEGKSTTALNLAISLAELGKKVMLVDADIRKSVMVSRIKAGKTEYGLSHFLAGQCQVSEAVYAVRNIDDLYLMVAGPVVPNPTEYKRRKGIIKTPTKQKISTLWKYYTIADMLENEMYIGNMVQGKYGSVSYKTKKNKPRPKEQWYRVEGTHEPIIEKELWEKVKAMREQKAKPFITGTMGLFSGKARCAECGYVLRSGKRENWRFLTCPNRSVSKDACGGAFISVSRLESKVMEELKRLAENYLDQEALEQGIQWDKEYEKQKNSVANRMKFYEKKILDRKKVLRALYLDQVRGILTEEDYLDMSKAFSAEKKRLEEAMKICTEQIQEIEERKKAGGNGKELVEKYIHVEHLTREMVEALVDHVDVGRRISGSRDVPITIYWNF